MPGPYTWPPQAPTISGDNLTISAYLQPPTLMVRDLRTIIEQRLIADRILTGKPDARGGAVQYQQTESVFPDRVAEAVEPGADYPVTSISSGVYLVASVRKWGLDAIVSYEASKRMNFDVLNRALAKLTNGVVLQIDKTALAAIAASGIDTFAAPGVWSSSTRILRDIATADAQVAARNQGYATDTLVMSDLTFATMFTDPTIINAFRRENPENFVYKGINGAMKGTPLTGYSILGKMIMTTPNLPVGINVMLLDASQLGGMADEEPLLTKVLNLELQEEYRIRARRITVPIVNEPLAAISITGT